MKRNTIISIYLPVFMTCIMALQACSDSFKGKRVLVTAPEGYAQRLSKSIDQAGGVPVAIAMIETVIPDHDPEMDSLLMHLDSIDWVAFPSRKAIQSFFACAGRLQIAREVIRKVNYCAIGKDTELLIEHGLQPAITPKEASPSGIVAALREEPGIEGQTIVVLAPNVVRLTEPDVVPNFVRDLKAIPMKVIRVDAYTTRPAEIPEEEQFVRSVLDGEYDVIAFTSTAEIEAFIEAMGGHELPENQTIACFGPYTASNARKLGLKVDIVSKDFSSFDGFADAIKQHFE